MFSDLFDYAHSRSGGYLSAFDAPWEGLYSLNSFLRGLGHSLDRWEFEEIAHEVWAHRSAIIAPTAILLPPCIVDCDCEIRPNAYLRGGVLLGKNCVVGNGTEIKNAILFDGVKAPHFNYIGDSILGFNAHLGAGSLLSNLRLDGASITIKGEGVCLPTGRKKLGSLLGDGVEIGCNCVLNPGTVVGRNSFVYPLSNVGGILPENCIFKAGEIRQKR